MARISRKNQITIPVEILRQAGMGPGEEVTVRAVTGGEIIIATRGSRVRRHSGIASGIYRPGEIEELRNEWDV